MRRPRVSSVRLREQLKHPIWAGVIAALLATAIWSAPKAIHRTLPALNPNDLEVQLVAGIQDGTPEETHFQDEITAAQGAVLPVALRATVTYVGRRRVEVPKNLFLDISYPDTAGHSNFRPLLPLAQLVRGTDLGGVGDDKSSDTTVIAAPDESDLVMAGAVGWGARAGSGPPVAVKPVRRSGPDGDHFLIPLRNIDISLKPRSSISVTVGTWVSSDDPTLLLADGQAKIANDVGWTHGPLRVPRASEVRLLFFVANLGDDTLKDVSVRLELPHGMTAVPQSGRREFTGDLGPRPLGDGLTRDGVEFSQWGPDAVGYFTVSVHMPLSIKPGLEVRPKWWISSDTIEPSDVAPSLSVCPDAVDGPGSQRDHRRC